MAGSRRLSGRPGRLAGFFLLALVDRAQKGKNAKNPVKHFLLFLIKSAE
jgi:hypothetical protein